MVNHSLRLQIGTQIKNFPDAVKAAAKAGGELALHTWSHTLLTTHDDLGVLGDLAWNMQIIYDLTGFISKLYRPPQGAHSLLLCPLIFILPC